MTNVSFSTSVINGRRDGPHLLITAGIHGDEFEGMLAVQRLANSLNNRGIRGKITLVPVVNEPAFFRAMRTAGDGLDLARVCPGGLEGSITIGIAHKLTELIRSADYYIDLHSGGTAMRVAPLVGYMLHSDARVLEIQRHMAVAFNLPVIWGTSPSLEGRSLSIARDAAIPAIYAEYLGGGACCDQGISDYYQGCLNVIGELDMLSVAPPVSRCEYFIEDARHDSGHLQIRHQSPTNGLFSASVRLMQEVSLGDVLGRVVKPDSPDVHEICAERSGVLIALAAFAKVKQGDCLGVVMETSGSQVECRQP